MEPTTQELGAITSAAPLTDDDMLRWQDHLFADTRLESARELYRGVVSLVLAAGSGCGLGDKPQKTRDELLREMFAGFNAVHAQVTAWRQEPLPPVARPLQDAAAR